MSTPEPTPAGYVPVPTRIDLTEMEHDVLRRWAAEDTFERSLEQSDGRPRWTFYEGPPTANGRPGTHHIEARVFKDVFPRFHTMRGKHVERKAGWDCHGLPVEVAVEKELGLSGKPQIETFGIAEFNAHCRESVTRHVDLFEEMTERMGYWVDTDRPYRTMDPEYVESVWWALKQIFDKGLLVEDLRIAPYCPRCGTGLSDHELAQGYEDVEDPSVYVRLPLTSGPYAGRASLLIWTTTPWTLPSNALVATKADVTYVTATDGNETVVVAEPLFEKVLGEGWTIGDRFLGSDMLDWTYQRPFDIVEWHGRAHFVVNEEYVTTEDGTGLVHQATMFGADDYESVKRNNVELINPIDLHGCFVDDVPMVGGMFFRDSNAPLIEDMQQRGVLFRYQDFEHAYPHCWRCHTALLYYGLPSWYVRTTAVKDDLIRENEGTTWHPDSVKHGRYGDWLSNNIDWALSRSRYWGTPLPIWRNDEDPSQMVCVGSLAELGELAGRDLSDLDPHRPYIDEITFTRDGVPGTFRRVEHVIDAWFDSGSMPFAQWGYPWVEGSKERFEQAFPADFICEAIDQTRGWFYTLMAVNTIVFDQSSYRDVVCLGHILAEDGRKMSKHLGNILEPLPLMDRHGADAVRWFMACSGSPWSARRIGHTTLQETVRKVILTYWNTVAFHVLYARTNSWSPTGEAPAVVDRHVLDRWLVSQREHLVEQVTDALEGFETQRAGHALQAFVDDLSNWYVRRSRRRFWDGDPSALWTLHETLDVVTRLMAPIMPFVTERVWGDVVVPVVPDAPTSVHLASWPTHDLALADDHLDNGMALVRRLVELGRSARAEAKVKTRQPLRRILVPSSSYARLDGELRHEIAEELNIGAVESFASAGDLVEHSAKGNFRNLGKRFGKDTPRVAAAISECDAAALAAALASDGSASVELDGEPVEVTADDVIITERPAEGWSVVNEQGETVALDLHLTPELVRAGLAREVVRLVQEARKTSGFDVSDRIVVVWTSGRDDVAEAVREHAGLVADEVLATSMTEQAPEGTVSHDDGLDLTFSVTQV